MASFITTGIFLRLEENKKRIRIENGEGMPARIIALLMFPG
jgi:hypothetical protein